MAAKKKRATSKGKTLSPLQRKFVEAFVGPAKGNATEAARLAGYKGNTVTLAAVGAENLKKPLVAEAIAERQAEASRAADWALADSLAFLVGGIRAQMSDVVEWGEAPWAQGQKGEKAGTFRVKSLDEIPEHVRPYIESVKQQVPQFGAPYLEVSLPAKLPYLRELNKLLGLHAPQKLDLKAKADLKVKGGLTRKTADMIRRELLGIRAEEPKG